VRSGRITFRQTPVTIVALEVANIAQTVDLRPAAGNLQEMYRKSAAGEGVMVSDNLAQLQHLTLGEVIEVQAPYGRISLPIVGIVIDLSDQQGAIILDRSLFIKYWRDDSVSIFRVYVKPDATVPAVRQRILERFEGQRRVFVLTNAELKSYILKITDQWFGLTSVQIAIAVLVAILGIVNTLTVSITDRRRELGVLQAVGGLRNQIRRTIWIEALSVAAIGLVLGGAVGAVNLYYLLRIVQQDVSGMRLTYGFPIAIAAMMVPIMLAAAMVAAIWPAEAAVRGSLVEALEYE
jgi:putative ABC transport system permease protein